LDIWKQIMEGVAASPQLSQQYDIGKIFEFVAELGGAKNIRSFKIQQGSPEQIQQQAQAGNLAPLPGPPGPSGLVQPTLPQPGNRLAEGGGF
jgi:hypothetical protein